MDAERNRKQIATILQALAKVGQDSLATRTGVSESTISRLKSEGVKMNLEEVAKLIVALDLKCVPVEMQCYRPDSIQSILTLAKERMAQLETPDQLKWEE